MASRKPSAKAKRVAEFKAQLGGMDDAFARERQRSERRKEEREEALREKACLSKSRYACLGDAQSAILSCAEHGAVGLHAYRCPHCGGWHLTSKPVRS